MDGESVCKAWLGKWLCGRDHQTPDRLVVGDRRKGRPRCCMAGGGGPSQRLVSSEEISMGNVIHQHQLDLTGLTSGTYLVSLHYADKVASTTLIKE